MRSMGEWELHIWTTILLVLLLQIQRVLSQDDYSEPITCYFCFGKAGNSTCADPIDVNSPHLVKRECLTGVCVKWTRYRKGILYMERTCSNELNFHITMIDGVCRTERNGNGYLCMCGKHLCNNGLMSARHHPHLCYLPVLLTGMFVLKFWTSWWNGPYQADH